METWGTGTGQVTECCWGDDMDWARVQYLTGKKTCGKPRRRWQHSIKMRPKSV